MNISVLAGTIGRVLTVGRRSGSVDPRLRAQGDAARDNGLWTEAVSFYREHLAEQQGDASIWVQLGNCSKEAGDHTGALLAYDTALDLNDRDADTHLQKGHLLKLMSRPAQAIESFRTSLGISPKHNPALKELLALGALDTIADGAQPTVVGATIIYIDVTDILDYLRVNESLSGIQRVVANLIDYADAFEKDNPGCHIRPVFPDYNDTTVYTVRMGLLAALIEVVAQRAGRSMIDRALDAVKGSRTRVTLTTSDTLLIPGAFWIYQRYDLLNRLRRDGVRVTVFIHDLIQITNPDYVEPAATTVFRRSFVDVLCASSFLMSNSRYVAADIATYLRDRMNFTMPVVPIPLATELGAAPSDDAVIGTEVREAVGEDYVLYVSTIEVRKNHLYLIKVWEQLIAEKAAWIPNLVFVGKWGWEIDALRRHLAASDYLGGRLFIFNGIADAELALLYRHCQFTVYPSYAEGWGLPVGESLGYGKPCVASRATSIPEVGGDFCKYIDPDDWRDGHRVIAGVLADRPALDAWAATVRNAFRSRTWKAFAFDLFGTVAQYARDPRLGQAGNNCWVDAGEIVSFGNDALAQLDARGSRLVTGRMARLSGWHGIEPWGCWAARRRAVLAFNTRLAPGSDVLVYLFLRSPENDLGAECTVRIGTTETLVDDLGPTPRWCTARGAVSAGGEVRVTLVSGRGFQHLHGRELFVGIVSLAISASDDRAGRERVLAHIVPGGLVDLAVG